MGGMGKESLPHICTSDILHLFLGWWFYHHRHIFAKSAMSVPIIWSLVIPCISNTFFLVEPNARTPYIGCYATQYDPIAIFLSWALLLLYDKGAVVDYYRILNPECAENLCISDVHIDDHCSLESSSLWGFFDADSSLHFSEIIQIARQVEALSWRLYTEMVGPMYSLFSLSSKGLNRGFVLLLSIWCVHISCIFSVLTPSKWYRW